jgi:predicted permease
MLEIISLIVPVFGLIGLGFAAAKGRFLEPDAARTLTMFGYKVAMPALLFRAMAGVGEIPLSPFWLALTYFSGIVITWVATTLASRLLLRRPAEDAPAMAMGACFSNGVMLGFPVILLALGPETAAPLAILATCETLGLWIIGTLHMGFASMDRARAGPQALLRVLLGVAKNPLIIALAAGFLWRAGGLSLPGAASRLVDLIAGSAIPVSLFALGMSLVAHRLRGEAASVALLCVVKLALYPALAFWLATEVFHLPRIWAGALVIYVSMPVGANAFVYAALYDRAVPTISAAVAISTALSVISVTIALALLQQRGIVIPT